MFLTKLIDVFSVDIVIDLGTTRTIIYKAGKGIVLNEPSVVAVVGDYRNRQVLEVGDEAVAISERLAGKVILISPLQDGVITDFDMAELMIRLFIKKTVGDSFFSRPRVIITVPVGSTSVERRSIEDAALHCRASKVYLIEGPMAAAVGAGIPVNQPECSLIVDCGGGTTEIAAIADSKIVKYCSLRFGGDYLNEAIVESVRINHGVVIDEFTAERVKLQIDSVLIPSESDKVTRVTGVDARSAEQKQIEIPNQEIAEAMYRPLARIVDGISLVLNSVSADMASDIVDRGVVLVGGGAKTRGLDKLISNATSLPVILVKDPELCVVLGASRVLKKMGRFVPLTGTDASIE